MHNKSIRNKIISKIKSSRRTNVNYEHQCDLPPPVDLTERYICSGWFVYTRRKIKNLFICSELNSRTKLYFKSSNAIFLEKYEHLEFDFNMIHPFSVGRAYWEFFMLFILLLCLNYIPIYICLTHNKMEIDLLRLFFDFMCWIDIIMNFCTGYQHPLTKKVIMRRRLVVKHYLTSWFIIDILSSINPDIIIYLYYLHTGGNIWQIKVISMVKIFRFKTIFTYLTGFRERYQFSWLIHQLIKVGISISVMILWHACILFLVALHFEEVWMIDDNPAESFQTVMSRTIGCLLVIGERGTRSTLMSIYFLEAIYTVTGWIYRIIITIQVAMILLKSNPLRKNHSKLIQEFDEYCTAKNLPKVAKNRVLAYLNFKFRGKFYREVLIDKTLSNSLKQEINTYICTSILATVEIFKNLPEEIVTVLSKRIKHQIYLQNDIIVTADTPCEEIIFNVAGMASIYNPGGKEVNHFLEGDCYGEHNLFVFDPINEKTIVAIDCCEVYMISHQHFKKALTPYPEIWVQLCKNAGFNLLEATMLLRNNTLPYSQRSSITLP